MELGYDTAAEAVADFLRRKWFVVALILVGVIVTAVGYLAYHPMSSGVAAPLVMVFNSYRLGWVYIASMFVEDQSLATLIGTVLMSVYTSALVYILFRPLFEYENLVKAATVLAIIALVAVALLALFEVVRKVLGW